MSVAPKRVIPLELPDGVAVLRVDPDPRGWSCRVALGPSFDAPLEPLGRAFHSSDWRLAAGKMLVFVRARYGWASPLPLAACPLLDEREPNERRNTCQIDSPSPSVMPPERFPPATLPSA